MIRYNKQKQYIYYEYCPNCDANLTLQKGYSNDLPAWVCKGCGQKLINPEIEMDSNISWECDECKASLIIQPGFSEDCGEWKCTKCGCVNKICPEEVYLSEDEYQASLQDPYKGLSDEAVLELSMYEDLDILSDKENIILIRDRENARKYVKKYLKTYEKSIYEYLLDNPIEHMPRIHSIYESKNCLVIIEDYIEGRTIEDILNDVEFQTSKPISEQNALCIVICICEILECLHGLSTPIIHRDIKPSNVIVNKDGEVFLLDMNAAKWYKEEQIDDTRYIGTQNYAAPEQAGFGMVASSDKSDIYGLGVLFNVMLTGELPKVKKAPESYWKIIERCIDLNPDNRYTAKELHVAIDELVQRV